MESLRAYSEELALFFCVVYFSFSFSFYFYFHITNNPNADSTNRWAKHHVVQIAAVKGADSVKLVTYQLMQNSFKKLLS